MKIKLSDHFTFKKLLKAVLPSICMMVFTSIYSIVDGFCVSNFATKSAFAGLNLIYPVVMIIGAIGFMLGAGGSALVSNTLGEGDNARANKIFTMTLWFTVILGGIISAIVFAFMEEITLFLVKIGGENITQEAIDSAIVYGRIMVSCVVFFMLQNMFQNMFVVAEKSNLGFVVTAIAGGCNIVLDALFVGVFRWGVAGAAVASVVSQFVGMIIPVIYFSRKNTSLLRFTQTKLELKVLAKASLNGSSELLSNIAMSVVSILFNMQLMKLAGEDGVSAYGIIMYAGFIFCAIFIGYIIGVAPIIGYHNGAKNYQEVKNILKKSILFNGVVGVLMVVFVVIFAQPLSSLFTHGDQQLLELTTNGFRLYGISFGLCGFCIFSSGFFTALNDGLTSAVIAFSRTLVFQIVAILWLPTVWGLTGVWLSIVFAEICSVLVCVVCFVVNAKRHHYWDKLPMPQI